MVSLLKARKCNTAKPKHCWQQEQELTAAVQPCVSQDQTTGGSGTYLQKFTGKRIRTNKVLMYSTNIHSPHVNQPSCHWESTHRHHMAGYFDTQRSPAHLPPQTYKDSSYTADAVDAGS